MSRRLTVQEQAFIEEARRSKIAVDAPARRKRPRRISLLASRTFWSWAVVLPAILFSLGLWYAIFRVQSLLGPENLELFAQEEITEETRKSLDVLGVGWLPEFFWWYRSRWTILGSVWGVTTLLLVAIQFVKLPKTVKTGQRKTKEDSNA